MRSNELLPTCIPDETFRFCARSGPKRGLVVAASEFVGTHVEPSERGAPSFSRGPERATQRRADQFSLAIQYLRS